MKTQQELMDAFKAAISAQEFSAMERLGFAGNNELALLAGAVIGYQVAINEVMNEMDERTTLPKSP
jgi:hypothetical protein